MIIAAGADIKAKNSVRDAHLHIAAGWNHIPATEQVLNTATEDTTLSSIQSIHNHNNIVQSLCEKGADAEAEDMLERMPLFKAGKYNSNQCMSFLLTITIILETMDELFYTCLPCMRMR
jgi:ankyrin repeat protein